jgi:hypothetical protein
MAGVTDTRRDVQTEVRAVRDIGQANTCPRSLAHETTRCSRRVAKEGERPWHNNDPSNMKLKKECGPTLLILDNLHDLGDLLLQIGLCLSKVLVGLARGSVLERDQFRLQQ